MNNVILSTRNIDDLVSDIANEVISRLPNLNPSQTTEKELITRHEAAKLLNVNITTIHRWTEKGKLKPYGIGGRVYFKKGEVLDSVKPLK